MLRGVEVGFTDAKTGIIAGTVFVADSNGQRSPVSGAGVRLSGDSISTARVTDRTGNYSFRAVPAVYQIEAKAPGLVGTRRVKIVARTTVDVPIQLEIKTIRQTDTVNAKETEFVATWRQPRE